MRRAVRFSGASGDKDHRDIGPKRFTFFSVAREGRRGQLPADYIWQRDKTREGLGSS